MSAANAKAKANANAAKTEELKGLIENLPNTTIQEIFKHVGLDIVAEIPKEYTDKLYGITGNYTFPDYINKIFCAYNYTNIGSDVESNKKLIRNYIKCSTCDYSIAKPHTPPTQDITAALPYNHINLSFDFNDPSNNYFVIGMGMVVDAEVVYTPTEVTKAVNARYSVNFSLRIDATQIIIRDISVELCNNQVDQNAKDFQTFIYSKRANTDYYTTYKLFDTYFIQGKPFEKNTQKQKQEILNFGKISCDPLFTEIKTNLTTTTNKLFNDVINKLSQQLSIVLGGNTSTLKVNEASITTLRGALTTNEITDDHFKLYTYNNGWTGSKEKLAQIYRIVEAMSTLKVVEGGKKKKKTIKKL